MTKVCTRCIMTNKGDSTIRFDRNGVCDYCTQALERKPLEYFPNEEGSKKIEALIAEIKEYGKDLKYDCLMGLSGGLDSSYLAYLGFKWGLRILAVHADDGFDTPFAKSNIQKIVDACNIDLINVKPDEREFDDLTLAFMKASLPNLAIPQDNAIASVLYNLAKAENIKYFLSGDNFALESILQRGNTYSTDDVTHIRYIQKRFGSLPPDKLKIISRKEKQYLRDKLGIKTIKPLNYIEYNKERAINELKDFCGYQYYEAKHYESVFTRFLQAYYLPEKFDVDKRTSHLSSLVIDGQMTREDALKEMKNPPIRQEQAESDIGFVCQKFEITREEFDAIMALPPKRHTDYKIDRKVRCRRFLSKLKRKFLK